MIVIPYLIMDISHILPAKQRTLRVGRRRRRRCTMAVAMVAAAVAELIKAANGGL